MESKPNVSPLRYPGGKTRACKVLHEILATHYDMNLFDTLVSPFFGGGSFEFYLQNKYSMWRLIVNDKFTPLYQFWKQVQSNKNLLCDELRKIPAVTKDMFTEYRKTILTVMNDPLQQAIQYFIINRCSFSGATLSGGFSAEAAAKRFTPSSIDRIQALHLTNMEIYNMDFADFIPTMFESENSLLFLDPPYYLEKSNLYGNNGDMHENFNHRQLAEILQTKKNWILTYNDCPFIRDVYNHCIIVETKWSYGMNKTKESSEIVILPNR